jgi:hypothetical protein
VSPSVERVEVVLADQVVVPAVIADGFWLAAWDGHDAFDHADAFDPGGAHLAAGRFETAQTTAPPRASPAATTPPRPTPAPAASPSAEPTRQQPHQALDVEALLPTTVGDVRYDVGSIVIPIDQDLAGGDICIYFCPGEVGDWARLGTSSGNASVAFAVPASLTGDTAAIILAVRLPAATGAGPISDSQLEDAWVATHPQDQLGDEQGYPMSLGGRHVRLVVQTLLSSDLNRYIHAHAGTLYLVGIYARSGSLPDITKPGPLADAVFAALP